MLLLLATDQYLDFTSFKSISRSTCSALHAVGGTSPGTLSELCLETNTGILLGSNNQVEEVDCTSATDGRQRERRA